MFHPKHTIAIALFFTGCTTLMLYSMLADFSDSIWDKLQGISEKKKVMSHFVKAEVYYLKGGAPYLFLASEGLSIDHDEGKAFFQNPNGNTFTSDQEKVYYSSLEGSFDQKKGQLLLKNDVLLKTDNSKITADTVNYLIKTGIAQSDGNVKSYLFVPKSSDEIFIDSDRLESNITKEIGTYRGNVSGKLVRKRSYEEGVQFNTDSLYFDLPQMEARLMGNVSLKKQRLTATAREGQLFLENYNKKLKYFSLRSDVKLREKVVTSNGRTIIRRAYAEDLEGLMKDAMIVLTGYPKVYQESDVIRGNKIILREDNSVIEVDDASSNFRVRK